MVMANGQDPDILINEVYYLRYELEDMGRVFNDDSIPDVVLEELTDEYLHRRLTPDFTFICFWWRHELRQL